MKKIISKCLVIIMITLLLIPETVQAATVKISKTKATLEVDATLKLKITGTDSKVTWSTSKKSVATVSKSGTITAKAEGTAVITATVDGKKYACDVKVVNSNKNAFNEDFTIGEYLVGDDVKEGKYNLEAIKGWGIILIYNSEKDYENDEIWKKSINLCSPELEDTMLGLYVPEYRNLNIKKGNYIVINHALTVNFKSK